MLAVLSQIAAFLESLASVSQSVDVLALNQSVSNCQSDQTCRNLDHRLILFRFHNYNTKDAHIEEISVETHRGRQGKKRTNLSLRGKYQVLDDVRRGRPDPSNSDRTDSNCNHEEIFIQSRLGV